MREPVRSIALRVCEGLGVPLRNLCPELHYFTKFYGQTNDGLPLPEFISVEWLIEILSFLPAGWTVLVCHPGYVDGFESTYRTERVGELKTLSDPGVQAVIAALGIKLCSFNDWKHLRSLLVQPIAKENRVSPSEAS